MNSPFFRRGGDRRMARVQRVSAGGGGALTLRGISGFSSGNTAITTGSPSGIVGSATGFHVRGLFRITTQSVSSTNREIVHNRNAATFTGFDVVASGSYATLSFRAYDGSTNRSAGSFSLTASVGQVVGFVARFDATDGLSLWVNRTKNGASTAVTTGYTVGTGPTGVGSTNTGTNQADNGCTIYGVAGGNWSPTQTQIETWFDDCKSTYSLATMGGGTDVARWPIVTPLVDPIDDAAGSADLDITGTLTLVSSTTPTWAW